MPDRLLIAGTLLLPDGPAGVRLAAGWLATSGGTIESMGEGPAPGRTDLGGPGFLVTPAFTDTHLHLPQFDSIGCDGLELLEWLDRVIFPAEARWADADFAGQMASRVACQLLSFGTTGIAAYATVHHEATQRAMAALAAAGLRGVVGQVLMDRGAPPELLGKPGELMAQAASLRSIGRLAPAVTPRFAVSCTGDLLRKSGDLAKKTGWYVQTHLSETQHECALVRELFGGASYTEVYREAGLLGDRSILGHGIWLGDEERRELARTNAVVAHCPTANVFLRSGAMDLAAQRQAGVRVSLGSDLAGGPDRSMVRVARAMIETAKRLGHAAPTAAECWWQITAGNAEILGFTGGGRLERGAPADIVVIQPDIPWTADETGLSTLLHAWDDRWLRETIAAGQIAYHAG